MWMFIFMIVKKIIRKTNAIVSSFYNYITFKVNRVNCGENLVVNGKIVIENSGVITIGNDVKINSSLKSNLIGGDERMILRTIGDGEITIGDRVGMSNSSIIAMNSVIIENDVMIGGNCKIYDTDFHSLDYNERMRMPDRDIKKAPVIIKKGAFIGAHTIILKGNIIGEKSIIGAGSLVSKNIPDGELWAGNPIRFIRKL